MSEYDAIYGRRRKLKMSNSSSSSGGGGGGCGCLSIIIFCLLVWALIFGVSVNGRHYGISCSMDRGVSLDSGSSP